MGISSPDHLLARPEIAHDNNVHRATLGEVGQLAFRSETWFNAGVESLTIVEAAPQLESLAELAINGETVLLTSKAGSLVLRPLDQSPSVPIHPPGFFDDIYDEEEIKLTNLAASLAPRTRVP